MNTDEMLLLNAMLGTVRQVRSVTKNPGMAKLAIDEELALMKRLKKAMNEADSPDRAPLPGELAMAPVG